jgi:hypothetical protein
VVRRVGTCGAWESCAGSLAIQVAEDVKIWRLRRCPRGVHHAAHLRVGVPVRPAANHQLESRVREIRMHGSEGGEAGSTGLPYPYLGLRAQPALRDYGQFSGPRPGYGLPWYPSMQFMTSSTPMTCSGT